MAKNLTELLKKPKYEFPEYSKEELKELENELENYKITKTLSSGEIITFYDDDSYLKDNGALSIIGDVFVTGYETRYNIKGEPYSWCDYPTKYEVLRDKIEKLYKLQGKREYAVKMNTKNIVENMQITNETKVEVF